MEEQRHLHLSRALRGRGPVVFRRGVGPHRLGRSSPSRPLPTVQSLACELCAQRGLDTLPHGILPPGGTIVSVDDLNFDVALVLLSIFHDARVYSDQAFSATSSEIRALSMRTIRHVAGAPILESIVGDLSNGRVVIISAAHLSAARKLRALRCPTRRVHVDISNRSAAQVLVEV